MRRILAVLTIVAAVGAAAPASAGNLDVRLGAFMPRTNTGAGNDLFQDDSSLYTVKKSDWRGFTGGVQYNMKLVPNVELGFSVDAYSRTLDTSYRDYVGSGGGEIRQTLKFEVVPVGVTLRLTPTSRRSAIAPYVGGGVDLLFWKYEEFGDFIDFGDPKRPILSDSFVSDGVTPGFHVVAGLRIPIGHDFGVTGEARYQWGKKDMGRDFQGNKIDLSGLSVTAGVNVRF